MMARDKKIMVTIGQSRGSGKTFNTKQAIRAFKREEMFNELMKEWGFGISSFIHYKGSIFHFHQKRIGDRYYVVQVDKSDYKHVRVGFMRSLSASCAEKFIKESPFMKFDDLTMMDGILIEGFAEKEKIEDKKILVFDINSDFYAKK